MKWSPTRTGSRRRTTRASPRPTSRTARSEASRTSAAREDARTRSRGPDQAKPGEFIASHGYALARAFACPSPSTCSMLNNRTAAAAAWAAWAILEFVKGPSPGPSRCATFCRSRGPAPVSGVFAKAPSCATCRPRGRRRYPRPRRRRAACPRPRPASGIGRGPSRCTSSTTPGIARSRGACSFLLVRR